MQYSPKLKKAMEQIKKIINDNDVAAYVVLHEPGFGEHFIKINPSYSSAFIDNEKLRVRSKLADFNGDKKVQETKMANTSNMLHIMTEVTGPIILTMMEMSDKLDKEVNANHFGGGASSHSSQNN